MTVCDSSGHEAGFSLMEVIVAVAIATIAVVGLAYTFGLGRTFINRFEVARAALGAAQNQMETLTLVSPSDTLLGIGPHHDAFVVGGAVLGDLDWVVAGVQATGGSGSDLKQVTVTVSWSTGTQRDEVRLSRLFPRQ